MNILVVHRNDKFVQIASQIAEELSSQAIVVSNARHVRRAYETSQPQIILYEFMLEDFDGIEMIQWLIQQGNTAKVVLAVEKGMVFAQAAIDIADAADLFQVSILPLPASRDGVTKAMTI